MENIRILFLRVSRNMWVSCLVVLVLLVCPSLQQVLTHTNGTSGEKCPVKRCLSGRADCKNKQCVCRPPFILVPDQGHFACYRENHAYGEVKNDPTVTNFNRESAQFPFPCRYLLTSARTKLRIDKRDVGTCQCELHSWNQKYRGKFYVGGFDFACQINHTEARRQLGFSVRKEGFAQNGHYTYTEYGVEHFRPDGPWTTKPVDINEAGVEVQCAYDTVNNQARVHVPACGWIVTFVAYDLAARRDQEQIPGLSFAVACGSEPFYLDLDTVIATAPVAHHGISYKDLVVPPLNIVETLLIRGFSADEVQNQPDASRQCSTVGNYLRECSKEKLALAAKRCFWILEEPRFLRCLDSEVDVSPALELLQVCISAYCRPSKRCQDFVDALLATPCAYVENIQILSDYVSGSLCKSG